MLRIHWPLTFKSWIINCSVFRLKEKRLKWTGLFQNYSNLLISLSTLTTLFALILIRKFLKRSESNIFVKNPTFLTAIFLPVVKECIFIHKVYSSVRWKCTDRFIDIFVKPRNYVDSIRIWIPFDNIQNIAYI